MPLNWLCEAGVASDLGDISPVRLSICSVVLPHQYLEDNQSHYILWTEID